MNLIGYNDNAGKLANKIEQKLSSLDPCKDNGLSIRGARRSGRSTFFAKVENQLNETESVNCFTGELSKATKEGFETALIEAISSSGVCKKDYSSFQGKVQSHDGFFELCTALNQNEDKPPVFLIDMGKSLEDALDSMGTAGVMDLSRHLKYIYNLMGDKRCKLYLVLGVTHRFVKGTAGAARDTWIDRYRNELNLTNTSFEGSRSESFRQIVSSISGVEIPEDFAGVWRGYTVTAGQLGGNLKNSAVTNADSQTLWKNLQGQWNIVETIHHEIIPDADLAELLLADAVIPENLYPAWLEECDGGFRATDALYEHFGFVSPAKDPSKQERIQRRLNDPHDDEVAKDILLGLSNHMRELDSLSELQAPESLGQKSAVFEVQVNDHPAPDLSDLERELSTSAFPRKLLVICILTGDPAEDALKERIEECVDQQGFLLILRRDGVDIGRIPLGRFVKKVRKIPHFDPVISLEQQITQLLSEAPDSSLEEEICSWICDAVQARLNVHPALSISHPTIKQLVMGTIAEGIMDIVAFAKVNNITQADAKKCLKLLTSPNVLTSKKGQTSWNPDKDVILNALMEHRNNEEKLKEQIRTHYTVNQFDFQELADLYQGITGDEGLGGLTEDKIIEHAKALHEHYLGTIKAILEDEAGLATELSEKYQAYCDRPLTDLSEVAPFREDILELKDEVEISKMRITEHREQNRQQLIDKQETAKQELEKKNSYFTDEEQKEVLASIKKARTLTSDVFRKTGRRIKERVELVDGVKAKVASHRKRLEQLLDFLNEERSKEIANQLDSINGSAGSLELDGVKEKVEGVEVKLAQIEEKRDQRKILTGFAVNDDIPDVGGDGIPAVGGDDIPDVGGDDIPAVGGDDIPAVGGDDIPDVGGDDIPAVGGDGIPDVGGDGIPDVGGDGIPDVGGDGIPDVGGDGIPDVGGDGIPDVGGDDIPDVGGDDIPAVGGDGIPDVGGDGLAGKIKTFDLSSAEEREALSSILMSYKQNVLQIDVEID